MIQGLLRKKPKWHTLSFWGELLLYFLCIFLITLFVDITYQFLFFQIVSILYTLLFCKEPFSTGFVTGVLTILIVLMVEIVVTLIVTLLFTNQIDALSYMASILLQIVILIMSNFIARMPFIQRLYQQFLLIIHTKIGCIMILMTLFSILLLNGLEFKNPIYSLILNIVMILFYALIIQEFLEQEREKESQENFTKFAKIYEEELQRVRLKNHRIQNELLMIQSYTKENKKVQQLIQEILLEHQNVKDEDILSDLRKIPSGGLQGILYFKLLKAKEENIPYIIEFGPEIHAQLFQYLDISTLRDICNILGVFLDNALESTILTKNPSLSIYVYLENKTLVFQITNSFTGLIDLSKMGKKRYTTKGKEHGYGLMMVQQILRKNKRLALETEIYNDIFSQTFKIKDIYQKTNKDDDIND